MAGREMNAEINLVATALEYLRLGLSVIPLRPADKRPTLAWAEFQSRRAREAEIRAWWAERPDLNIAIVCGRVSSVVVLDVDPRNGGDENLAPFPSLAGPSALTGGGGHHHFFALNGEHVPKIAGLLPGVDLQGEGSYVVAPPSVHPNGSRYVWIEGRELGGCPLPSIPFWLRRRIWERKFQRPASEAQRPDSSPLVLEPVLSKLRSVRRTSQGWVACCPVHEDRDPSLSIGLGTNGKLLLYCFAGCRYAEIRAALDESPR